MIFWALGAGYGALVLPACGDAPRPLAVHAGMSSGSAHCLNLAVNGSLAAAGVNHRGQLGFASESMLVKLPRSVPGLPPVAVAIAGNAHSVVLTIDGRVFTFGDNRYGQLGSPQPSFTSSARPVDISEPIGAIASGGAHALALATNGHLYGWGSNEDMQLGLHSGRFASRPVRLPLDMPGKAIGAAAAYSAVLLQDGAVELWGAGRRARHCCWPDATGVSVNSSGVVLRSGTVQVHEIPLSEIRVSTPVTASC